ncbi:DUF1598 domain-containing protein [Rhodopirellula halodulae]|uniref:DUF1598 domain-containing protein n=1 Tax=Rhodopirellula halodulae TaxID=2894198 RepID=UPI001E5EAE72|nr:DUF1598 domain-containing protein [Rhodopirellula sp. JC737]MCC9656528.1 DUF1598 domain-containing protein [Rhodopirellula sp. JC737]
MRLIDRQFSFHALTRFALAALFVALLAPASFSQDGGGGDGGDIIFGNPPAGVDVDAQGVLKVRTVDPRLNRQRLMQARANAAPGESMETSKLRKVSLNRLEKAVAEYVEANRTLPAEMLAMAGLTSVEYVFYYPETKDIVLAGPAEGYVTDASERFVGIESGRPSLLLEDVIVALRAFPAQGKSARVISVSIDPTPEGLQRMQKFLLQVGGRAGRGDTMQLVRGLKQNLGLQTVTIEGIPAATHFARVLVEADYRMKLIGIGLEQLPVPVRSYVARTNPATASANSMERWYFQPNYDGVSVSEDNLAMRINERGVQLVGANERVQGDGVRVGTGRVNRASQGFTKEFTEKYNLIADQVRVYAELRQLIDLSIAAAYIHEQDFYGQANWSMPILGNESAVSVETYTVPEKVETAVNAIWRGNTLMTPLGGGVNMQPRIALNDDRVTIDTEGQHVQVKQSSGPDQLAPGQWWWD